MTFTDHLALTIEHAAERLEMSCAWVEREIAAGRLPSVKYGRARRIRMSDLEQFVAERNDAQPKREPDRLVVMRRRRPRRQSVTADAAGPLPFPEYAPHPASARERGR